MGLEIDQGRTVRRRKETLSVNSTAVSRQFTVPLRVSSGCFSWLPESPESDGPGKKVVRLKPLPPTRDTFVSR